VSEAHRSKIIHGDLKSSNVILTMGPDELIRAVILDFGLARRPSADSANPSKEVLTGTPSYMAPELWKGVQPSVTSDIYALGIISGGSRFWAHSHRSGRNLGDIDLGATPSLESA
jgi:serine/threonine protein kinase